METKFIQLSYTDIEEILNNCHDRFVMTNCRVLNGGIFLIEPKDDDLASSEVIIECVDTSNNHSKFIIRMKHIISDHVENQVYNYEMNKWFILTDEFKYFGKYFSCEG